MSKEKTQKYIVTQLGVCLKGTQEEELHARVELTETKAAALIGKVRLLEDYESDNKDADKLADMTAKLKAMTAERDELAKAVDAMTPKPTKK